MSNNKIYVSGLPKDATADEIEEVFGQIGLVYNFI
jgi:RNA recognition motif-containing protein